MDRELSALRACLLATLAACGSPEDWPVCGNEEEVTAEDYEGYGTLALSDFLVCGALPDDGACPDKDEVNAYTFFEESVGEASDGGHGYSLDMDCGPETTRTDACCYVIEYSGTWVSGRPLMVDGQARVAPLRHGAAWGARPHTSTDHARAASWATMARAEHASIAAFACFTLDLLALGAPAELVAEATRAQADEVEHARMTFALAAAAGCPVEPGTLDVRRTFGSDRVAIAVALVREGCVAETASAALAALSIDGALPEERAVLSRIAADERRHAQLAWRTAAWMLATFPEARAPMAEAFAEASAAFANDALGGRIVASVIGPSAEALFG